MEMNSNEKKQIPTNIEQDATMLHTELQKVQNSLAAERSLNQSLQLELDATNARLDELKTEYDNEKNVSFNLKYELDDVKGSLNEAFHSFDQLNQSRKEFVETTELKLLKEVDVKIAKDLTPEMKEIVEDLQKQIKSWQTKYEESSLELISERQKLLDAQHSRSENFYLQRDNNKLQKQLSVMRKQLQDLESRQEIQKITLETDQMTKKLIEDRKKSEEQHLRDDLNALRKELHAAQEKVKSHEELVAEVKQLQEKITVLQVTGTVKAAPLDAMVSSNEEAHSEVRLDEKFKYENGKEGEEKNILSLNKQERNSDNLKRLGYEEMRQEIDVLARELAAAQKEAHLEKEQLKTVVTNQTETIQVLSQRNAQQESTCETIQNELKNMKLSLSIITAERDSLRKRLHLAEKSATDTYRCNTCKDPAQNLDTKAFCVFFFIC
ncbi:unnamed protein product [Acanthosepion pharaonis]|uniref:Uncharacterized protein n=1 Tax=Acanthosepion pharaonis TaxID=158019 RepID=A0A812CHV9_ACAPH|nr:unnamed protein product [Sepia pharaonis]